MNVLILDILHPCSIDLLNIWDRFEIFQVVKSFSLPASSHMRSVWNLRARSISVSLDLNSGPFLDGFLGAFFGKIHDLCVCVTICVRPHVTYIHIQRKENSESANATNWSHSKQTALK